MSEGHSRSGGWSLVSVEPIDDAGPQRDSRSDDFMLVRPELVRRVGNGNAALVYARIEFRCAQTGFDRIEDADGRWWRASIPAIAAETGLTVKMARTALSNLIKADEIATRTHRAGGVSDQTTSYRPASLPASCPNGQIGLPKWADGRSGARPNGQMDVPKRADHHRPERADVPSIEELEKGGARANLEQVSRVPAGEPPRHCPKHPEGTTTPCRACGEARTAHEAWEAERIRAERQAVSDAARARAEDRARAIAACGLCDGEGYRNGRTCDHNPQQDEINARGSARVRAALSGRTNR